MILGTHTAVFLAIAEQGSLIGASKVLGIKPSSVTYHLKELEKELCIDLVDTSVKPAQLTKEGIILYRELLYENNRLTSKIEELKRASLVRPILNFGIVESLARNLGTDIVKCFRHNASEIRMKTGTSEGLLQDIKERKLDWAIVSRPSEKDDLFHMALFSEPSVLVLPKKLQLKNKEITWEDLKFCGLPLLRYIKSSGGHRITQSFLDSISVNLPEKIEVDDGGVMLTLIGEGLGWSMVRPATLIQHPNLLNNVHILKMPSPVLFRNLILVYRRSEPPSEKELIKQVATNFFEKEFKPAVLKLVPWLEKQWC